MALDYGNAVVIDGEEIELNDELDGEEREVSTLDAEDSDLDSRIDDGIAPIEIDGAEIELRDAIDGEAGEGGGGGGGTSNYNDLTNKPSINGVTLVDNKTSEDLGIDLELVTDLGEFSMEDYGWDFWAYLADKVDSGFYKLYETEDGFYYFFRVERAGNGCYQEYWYTEEGALMRHARSGYEDGDEWEWSDPVNWATVDELYSNFYTRNVVDNKLALKADRTDLNNYYTDVQIDDILENNYYNMDQIDEMLEDFTPSNMISTTWANLVALRDNAELTPGAYYRITDYDFVTTKANVRSAGHRFDIVVLAISESMVSESAYAVKNANDHYFEREITTGGIEWFYTLYVDDMGDSYGDDPIDHSDDLHATDVFCDSGVLPHPDTGDDVPVLYKTNSEEYDFDDPDYDDAYFYEGTYDFDGDEFDMWSKYEQEDGEWVFKEQYALTSIAVEDGELIVSPIPETKMVPVNMNAWELKYCLDNDKELFDWAATEGKGVIYYMKDEFGNEAPYDFKNALFQRKNITNTVNNNVLGAFRSGDLSRLGLPNSYGITCGSTNYWYYTFDTPMNAGHDSSLFGESSYNVIAPYILEGQRMINNIVLGFASDNNFGLNCFDLTLWGSCRKNKIRDSSNVLASTMATTTADRMLNSTFFIVSACSFGYNSYNNIGNSMDTITIGPMCQSNNFANGCNGVQIGSGFSNNTLGNYNYGSRFGNGVSNCTFGIYVSYCEFDGYNNNIVLPNYTRYCTFEATASKITINASGGGNSSQVQYVKVCKGVSNLNTTVARRLSYETIYYKTGRTENAV